MKSKKLIFGILFMVLASSFLSFAGEKTELDVFQDKGYFIHQSDDGQFKLWFDGRIMIDGGFIQGADSEGINNGLETRRARFAIKTIVHGDWAGEFDFDLADNELEIKDFWGAYIGIEDTIIKFGNHKMPITMDDVTTSRWTTFMERALINGFVPSRQIGLSVNKWGKNWTAFAGVWGQEVGTGEEDGADEQYGWAGRFVFNPTIADNTVLHFGTSYANLKPGAGEDSIKVRARELHLMERYAYAKVKDLEDYSLLGFEFATAKGPFSFQAEYMKADYNKIAGEIDASFDGYYAYVSWFITGENRNYNQNEGEFGAVHPISKKGAWEVALRYSSINLNDFEADITGGEESNITLGINWYANDNVKLVLNYIISDHDEFADGDGAFLGNDDVNIIAFRFQYLF